MIAKAETIISEMSQYESIAIAFSGGVDSAVVAALAKRAIGDRAFAITAVSETLAARELDDAKRLAKEIGIRHETMAFSELDDQDFVENNPSRCFFCQSMRFDQLQTMARSLQCDVVASGTNVDDTADHRPGLKAMKERNVYQPLLTHNVTKSEVRTIAQSLGLSVWDKPAKACLSSRIPHGLKVTDQRLRMIESAEDVLHEYGFVAFRVRHHDGLARIEVAAEERTKLFTHPERAEIVNAIQFVGFDRVAFDIRGYRTGSLNPGKS